MGSMSTRSQAIEKSATMSSRKWYAGKGYGTETHNKVFEYGDKYFSTPFNNVMSSIDFKILVDSVTELVQETVEWEVKAWNIEMSLLFAFNVDVVKKDGTVKESKSSRFFDTRDKIKKAYTLYKLTK